MDVLIVGAGLAGLTAAHNLHTAGREVSVVEARPRVGGRMHTIPAETPGPELWLDVGATWHWADQPRVRALAAELGVTTFPQFATGRVLHEKTEDEAPVPGDPPAGDPPAFRFMGGTQRLCDLLAERLPEGTVSLSTVVAEVAEDGDGLTVTIDEEGGRSRTLTAGTVVLTVPPRLVIETIRFSPELPEDLMQVIEATPTWMGEAVKCVAVYDAPFWREAGLSGSALSDVGPLSEVHDASNEDGSAAALWGFLEYDPDYREMDLDERAPRVLDQLARLFGPRAADPARYLERDWSADPYTAEDEHRHVAPLDYGQAAFDRPYLGGRLWWAGSETAGQGGGHMEGAVVSGERVARRLISGPDATNA